MENRLSQAELAKIVAEVERLSQRQSEELSSEQVQEILRELNLPPELLDEAIIQLRRREALSAQQQRNRWIYGGVAAAAIVAIASTGFFIQQNQQAIARVSAQQDRITFAQDNGGNFATINRQSNPEVFYRVTLKDAPIGQKLSLACDWISPSGQVVKQNRYQTRQIDKSVWNTYCRNQLGTAAPTGTWKVQMSLSGRPISDASFEVK
ncbi:DUF3859 domain-containing protein [Aerosakkonema sp. BLCC-F183]|uniref:DUF3859 domain-containing protein n=1 Tax=Aerosakkonema sp. BLCC-F183 TaxID=3342834 RepID=UPI0035B9FF54